jgi:hypothetical protein
MMLNPKVGEERASNQGYEHDVDSEDGLRLEMKANKINLLLAGAITMGLAFKRMLKLDGSI